MNSGNVDHFGLEMVFRWHFIIQIDCDCLTSIRESIHLFTLFITTVAMMVSSNNDGLGTIQEKYNLLHDSTSFILYAQTHCRYHHYCAVDRIIYLFLSIIFSIRHRSASGSRVKFLTNHHISITIYISKREK